MSIVPFDGSVIVQTHDALFRYNINGDLLAMAPRTQQKQTNALMLAARDGKFVLTAEENRVAVRRINDLTVVHVYEDLPSNICDMTWSFDERVLFVALSDGKLCCHFKKDTRSVFLP